jgi:hypothetical protein
VARKIKSFMPISHVFSHSRILPPSGWVRCFGCCVTSISLAGIRSQEKQQEAKFRRLNWPLIRQLEPPISKVATTVIKRAVFKILRISLVGRLFTASWNLNSSFSSTAGTLHISIV